MKWLDKPKSVVPLILVIAICLFVAASFVAVARETEARQVGSFEQVQMYTYETIVDEIGEYGQELPADISGTIVGLSVFRQESNQAWYPVVLNSVYDDDNIAEAVAFRDREFNGYFKHNEDNWAPIQEHIGKRLRIVIYVRDD